MESKRKLDETFTISSIEVKECEDDIDLRVCDTKKEAKLVEKIEEISINIRVQGTLLKIGTRL